MIATGNTLESVPTNKPYWASPELGNNGEGTWYLASYGDACTCNTNSPEDKACCQFKASLVYKGRFRFKKRKQTNILPKLK